MEKIWSKIRKAFAIHIKSSALQLPKDQELVEKIVYELNDYHDMKMQADPNEEGYAIGIIEEVLRHYAHLNNPYDKIDKNLIMEDLIMEDLYENLKAYFESRGESFTKDDFEIFLSHLDERGYKIVDYINRKTF